MHKTIRGVNLETRLLACLYVFDAILNDKVIKRAITVVCMSYILINIYINSRYEAYNLKLVYFWRGARFAVENHINDPLTMLIKLHIVGAFGNFVNVGFGLNVILRSEVKNLFLLQ